MDIQTISLVLSSLISLFTLGMLIIKPFRNWLLGIKKDKQEKIEEEELKRDTDKCLLRDRILDTYYKHNTAKEIKYYDFENVSYMYTQYKKLGGNSFVDKLWEEIQEWKVTK